MNFPPTEWSLILRASLHGDDAGRAALEELCRRYWPAVRDFLLVKGLGPEDAEDVAQEFFSSIVKSGGLHSADAARGKFRSFLLGAVERVLVDWQRRRNALKRGGRAAAESLENCQPEVEYPVGDEVQFDVAWAEQVLEMGMDALERDYESHDKGAEFALLVPFLSQNATAEASEAVAAKLWVSASALKSKIFRLRQRFRDSVLEEITKTVETPHEAEAEMAYLCQVLSSPSLMFPPGSQK